MTEQGPRKTTGDIPPVHSSASPVPTAGIPLIAEQFVVPHGAIQPTPSAPSSDTRGGHFTGLGPGDSSIPARTDTPDTSKRSNWWDNTAGRTPGNPPDDSSTSTGGPTPPSSGK